MKTTKFYSHSLTPENERPVAVLAFDQIDALFGSIIQLDGRSSYDPEREPLTFKWSFRQIPIGSGLTNQNFKPIRPDSSAVSFIPDKMGIYVVSLVVNDGELDSVAATCTVNISLSQVPVGEGKTPDAQFLWSYISDFWRLVEDREMITSIWSSVIQIMGSELVKLWSNDYNKSLSSIQQTVQRRWQKVEMSTDLSALSQRIIVGKNADGVGGVTGPVGAAPGTGLTSVFYTALSEHDFTSLRGNYGAKGRIISLNGNGHTINSVENVSSGGSDYSSVKMGVVSIVEGLVGVRWRLPQLLHTPGFDLEEAGVRAGDVLVFDVIRKDTGLAAELRTQVVCVDGDRLGFEFTLEDLEPGSDNIDRAVITQLVRDLKIATTYDTDTRAQAKAEALVSFMPPGINLASSPFSQFRIVFKAKKVFRNTCAVVPSETVSIPALQEALYDPPVVMRENLDYVVDTGLLTFTAGVFTKQEPAPDTLWAEVAFYDNSETIENNFGRMVGLSRSTLTASRPRASYLSSVKGLFYAYTNGPSIGNIRLGLQILLGLPFSEERGVVLSIEPEYTTDQYGTQLGRMLVEDVDIRDRKKGIRRVYYYPVVVGLEDNPATSSPYVVGDVVPQWCPISKGVEVLDYIKDPSWWLHALRGLEILKFFTFRVSINSEVFDYNDVMFAYEFINKIKPAYTKVLMSVLRALSDDIEIDDEMLATFTFDKFDDLYGLESCRKLEDRNAASAPRQVVGSHPFSSRVVGRLKGVETRPDDVVTPTSVRAYLKDGWALELVRAREGVDSPYTGAPVREGDLLAIAPNQAGSGPWWSLYEIGTVISTDEVELLCSASSQDPITYDYDSLDPATFPYGTDLVCSILRREVNPVVKGVDLSTDGDDAESLGSSFLTDGVSVDDHFIIETGANEGEYRIDGVSVDPPYISATQIKLKNLDGTAATLSVVSDQSFRIIRPGMMGTVVGGAKSVYTGSRIEVEVLDPDTGDPLDVFTPGLVGTTINVSGSDDPLNDGDFTITEYLHSGKVATGSGSTSSDAVSGATVRLQSPYHPGYEKYDQLRPFEVLNAYLQAVP